MEKGSDVGGTSIGLVFVVIEEVIDELHEANEADEGIKVRTIDDGTGD